MVKTKVKADWSGSKVTVGVRTHGWVKGHGSRSKVTFQESKVKCYMLQSKVAKWGQRSKVTDQGQMTCIGIKS